MSPRAPWGAAGFALILPAWGLSAVPALAQRLAEGQAAPFPWWRWFAAIGFCLLLAVAGAYALRARVQGRGLALPRALGGLLTGASAAPRRVTVLESVRVSPGLEICLVRCDAQEYLLAATPQGAIQLSPPPAGPAGAGQ